MDIQPVSQQSMSDDQELAKVLAGINQQADEVSTTQEEVIAPIIEKEIEPTPFPAPVPVIASAPSSVLNTTATDLDSIKKDALNDLRPLVDKLNVSSEEKFDTYLLLLRSTDDATLIRPAYESARGINDEARRAQALLDIIKEIDFLSQQPAV